jgi:xanthine dehydrogenase YagT iron-sulfur-binding subunit
VKQPRDKRPGMSRRRFVIGTSAPLLAGSLPAAAAVPIAGVLTPAHVEGPGIVDVTLAVNGQQHALRIEPRVTLLDVLRERLHLTGTKKGCDQGTCGACTVHVDGRRVLSCLSLAIMQRGRQVTTIEGLASAQGLHPMQAAFVARDGMQCGYCTPGQVMSAVAMLNEAKRGEPSAQTPGATASIELSAAEIRERMSGNICRCGAYPNIVAAIEDVAQGQAHASA